MFGFKKHNSNSKSNDSGWSSEPKPQDDSISAPHYQSTQSTERLPMTNGITERRSWRTIHPTGESGRTGFHPFLFLLVCFQSTSRLSMAVNILWPIVPAAIVVHFATPDRHLLIFVLNYIAMIPAANLIGFAGQGLARKLPKVVGVLVETTLGSVVEIIVFMVLVRSGQIAVVRSAILGSILANILLCLGICFVAGGFTRHEQVFHEAISEVGSGLLLVAGFGMIIPAAFATIVGGASGSQVDLHGVLLNTDIEHRVLAISRSTSILLLIAYFIYLYFQMSSHHGIIDEVLEGDEELDTDRHKDMAKKKHTFTECIVALVIAIACVALIAVFLVFEIPYIVAERGITEAFMGLILVPVVEKAAEHLSAIDEAWDNQANFALTHVLGASIQTALLNTPLVVIVGWCLGQSMDLNFEQFQAIVLILAIIVVGNFLRDGKSNYLEGSLCVLTYVMIAVTAYYYPNPAGQVEAASTTGAAPTSALASSAVVQATTAVARLAMRAP